MLKTDRRAFLLAIFSTVLAACSAKIPGGGKEEDPEAAFNEWLRKKRRHRRYNTLDEAKKAWMEDREREGKEREWKEYRKKHKLY